MTILGHDCDGKPLHAGDRVILLWSNNPPFASYVGHAFTVSGACDSFPNSVDCEEKLPFAYSLRSECIRRMNEDNKPCGMSFEELMHCLKRGIAA